MIIFRSDAGPELGFGHIARCRTLARALKEQGQAPIMVGPAQGYATSDDAAIFDAWHPTEWVGEDADAHALLEHAREHDATFAVLDDYRIDIAYQRRLKQAGLRFLIFDGAARRRMLADIVLNTNPAATPELYAPVLDNPDARLLLGPEYAILRPEFSATSRRSRDGMVERVLVTFGGGDDRGGIVTVLSALCDRPIRLIVISGRDNPRNEANRDWIARHCADRVDYHVGPPNVAELMAGCDLAVMAGGTSIYEAACCGLPMILIAIAENQVAQPRALADRRVAFFLGGLSAETPSHLLDALTRLADEQDALRLMAERGGLLVDGRGAGRVAREVLEQASRNGGGLVSHDSKCADAAGARAARSV